jgi:lipoprotein-anchoring transpeptidase ErfK/SrfK
MRRRAFLIGSLAILPACDAELWDWVPPPVGDASVPPQLRPRIVEAPDLPAREIHVYPESFALLWTRPGGKAIRYVVGIGRPGRYVSGRYYVGDKREWPRWTPTAAMIRREPELYGPVAGGLPGGPDNPLGARALYLYRPGGGDSLLRIHGTPDNRGLGRQVSNGCVRMANAHVIQLYSEVPVGTRVVLHPR